MIVILKGEKLSLYIDIMFVGWDQRSQYIKDKRRENKSHSERLKT